MYIQNQVYYYRLREMSCFNCSWRTGNVPGIAASNKETFSFVIVWKLIPAEENNFEADNIWAWTSIPMTLSHFLHLLKSGSGIFKLTCLIIVVIKCHYLIIGIHNFEALSDRQEHKEPCCTQTKQCYGYANILRSI